MTKPERADLYTAVTNRIIAALESGPERWVKFWQSSADTWRPVNHGSDRTYRGINLLLLAGVCHERGLAHNRWLTFNQARELGGMVRKGSKGVPVVFWKPLASAGQKDAEPANDERESQRRVGVLARQFFVFNVADCDGLPESVHDVPRDESLASRIVHRSGARIIPGEPCYRADEDVVQLPQVSAFGSEPEMFAVAFHELSHWCAPRVGREQNAKRFGDDAYAVEELIAELGSAMLCGACGFTPVSRAASYLDHWIRVLRQDSRAIFTVASAAQTAADYLLERADQAEAAAVA
ncbi:MAG: antirestriction protein ArdC [Myxococcaceae bacterium]|nr:antirestriction protein ArdC [Myxococcaceae bacterium]